MRVNASCKGDAHTQLVQFCLPHDLGLLDEDQVPAPTHWAFMLTDERGHTLHGVSLCFYEKVVQTEGGEGGVKYTPRSLSLISRWCVHALLETRV